MSLWEFEQTFLEGLRTQAVRKHSFAMDLDDPSTYNRVLPRNAKRIGLYIENAGPAAIKIIFAQNPTDERGIYLPGGNNAVSFTIFEDGNVIQEEVWVRNLNIQPLVGSIEGTEYELISVGIET